MDETYAAQEMIPAQKGLISKPDLREGLIFRLNRLKQQTDDIQAAIDALDKNPEVARILELVGKASRY